MTAARTGRPPLTSPSELLDAAHEIGFEHLTVGAVTSRCGVKYSTFYRHFKSLAALQTALVDLVLEGAHIPHFPDWQAQLAVTVSEFVGILTAYPGLADAITGLPDRPAWLTTAHERAVGVLTASGFDPDQAEQGVDAVLTVAGMGPDRYRPEMTALLLDGLATRRSLKSSPDQHPEVADV